MGRKEINKILLTSNFFEMNLILSEIVIAQHHFKDQ